MIAAPASKSGARRRVDWRRAAKLLARGRSTHEVAQTLGCAPVTLDKRLRRDGELRATIAQLAAAFDPEEERLKGLRQTLHRAIDNEVQNGNVRVILWLADRLKLIRPPEEQTANAGFEDLLDGLSADELKEFEALKDPD